MNAITQPRPLRQSAGKETTTVEVNNAVDLHDLTAYFRRERGMSGRNARFHAREVYRDEAVSRRYLPTGWHEAIHPQGVTFTRGGASLAEPFTPVQHAQWLKAGGDRA